MLGGMVIVASAEYVPPEHWQSFLMGFLLDMVIFSLRLRRFSASGSIHDAVMSC